MSKRWLRGHWESEEAGDDDVVCLFFFKTSENVVSFLPPHGRERKLPPHLKPIEGSTEPFEKHIHSLEFERHGGKLPDPLLNK